MKNSPRATKSPRQQPLPLPPIDGQVDLWIALTERHRLECRQVLCQMLVAITRQSRNDSHDDQEPLTQKSEQLTDD